MADKPAGAARKRGPKPSFDEDAVVDQLVGLFWEKGYSQTSHADMRATTGLSGSSLYNGFGDKAAIFDRVLARYHERSVVLVQPLVDGDEGLSDLLRWVDVLQARVNAAHSPPGCLMIATMGSPIGREPEVQRHTRANVARVRDALTVTLARAASRCEIEQADVAPLAATLAAAYVGVLAAARGAPTPESALQMLAGLRHAIGRWFGGGAPGVQSVEGA